MAASAPVVPLGHDATIRPVLLANWGLRRYQWRGFSRRSSAVEHPLRKRVVGGSNPSAGTDQKSCATGTNRAKIPPYPSRFNPIAGPGKQPGKHPIKKKPRRQGRGSTLVRGCLSRPMPGQAPPRYGSATCWRALLRRRNNSPAGLHRSYSLIRLIRRHGRASLAGQLGR